MTRSLLKEAIRMILVESDNEESLKKWAKAEGDDLERFLADHGYPPVPSGGYNSFVGSGASASVYEVALPDGKRGVAKFMPPDEGHIYEAIKNLRSMAPKTIARHLPVIYDVLDHKSKQDAVVIVEHLEKLDDASKSTFFGETMKSDIVRNAENLLANKKERDTLVAAAYRKSYISGVSKMFNDDLTVWKNAINACVHELTHAQKTMYAVTKITMARRAVVKKNPAAFSNVLGKNNILKIQRICSTQQVENLIHHLADGIMKFIGGDRFPQERDSSYDPLMKNVSGQARKIRVALSWLEKNGVVWFDVHVDNIMIRKSTGDWVLSDVGLFEIRG
jgi:hypothetical protein